MQYKHVQHGLQMRVMRGKRNWKGVTLVTFICNCQLKTAEPCPKKQLNYNTTTRNTKIRNLRT